MSEWEDVGWEDVPDEQRRAPQTPLEGALGTASTQLQNVGEGLTMGFRDEAEALVNGMWDERPYTVRLKDIEARRAQENVGNPWELPAKIAGGLGTGALGAAAIAPTTLLGTAGVLAGEGMIAGAGTSPGTLAEDPQQVAESAALGGATGLALGAALGTTANLAYKALSPTAQRVAGWIRGRGEQARQTTHERNLQTARELDVPTTAPERLADESLMMKQARYESDEILADVVKPTLDARQARVNQIARQEVGLPPADDINRFDLGQAARNIRDKFKSVEGSYQTATLDNDIMNRLDDVVTTRGIVKPPEKAVTAVNRTMEMLDEGMTGSQYLQQRSQLDKEIQAIYKSANPDVRLAETYAEIVDVLDDKFASQLTGEAADTLQTARKQWKNLRLLDRPNAVKGGDVALAGIKTGLNRNKGFLRGMDETPLAKLSDLADSTKFNFGRSGTAERSPFNLLQRAQSTLEKPFAGAVIERGGMLGLRGGPEASAFGGAAAAGGTPALLEGTEILR
jgi:hypothetical protein